MQSSESETGLLPRAARAALLAAGMALVSLAAVQAWQVIARYVLNDSPGWTEPLALLLLNTAMSLGAAAAVQQRQRFGPARRVVEHVARDDLPGLYRGQTDQRHA
ncbi:MAG TPA: TRAP transporter small permease subunit, partial [Tahibacter sp.]|nr:TRAP transporter small permease subunit [Tahibacter sp.]